MESLLRNSLFSRSLCLLVAPTSKTRDGIWFGQRASVKSSSIVPEEGLQPKRRTALFDFYKKILKLLVRLSPFCV